MKNKIIENLKQIEKENEIEILLACETGSRAWGFPSPDSDYDVRIIYKHKPEWYLTIKEGKDSIDLMLEENEIDISGWELRKSLRLLQKSNPPLLERIQSPEMYLSNNEFLESINTASKNFYSKIATIHHYAGMAHKAFSEVDGNSKYKLKKLFYSLRASLACKWIIQRDEIVPIEFPIMLEGISIDESIKTRIQELIELKSVKSESYLHSGELEVQDLINESLFEAGEKSKSLPSANGNVNELNNLLRQFVR